jgi:CRP-like cAMP-binding protein
MLEQRHFKAGQTILREGEIGETAYIIQKGQVRISRGSGEGGLYLATLGPGETLGEMSMIDDKPRSATAVALEDAELTEIHRDDFFEALQTDPEATILILASLFERLREANSRILRLEGSSPSDISEGGVRPGTLVRLRPVTPEAEAAVAGAMVTIDRFPYRIGRESHNPLVHNDLELCDQIPWQISRHHAAFVLEEGRVGVIDRGSTLGSTVDGQRIGGPSGKPGPVFFTGSEGTLVLGKSDSRYEFQIVVEG